MSESTKYLALKSSPAFMQGSALKFVGRSGGHMNLQVIIQDKPTLNAFSLNFNFFNIFKNCTQWIYTIPQYLSSLMKPSLNLSLP